MDCELEGMIGYLSYKPVHYENELGLKKHYRAQFTSVKSASIYLLKGDRPGRPAYIYRSLINQK